MSCCRPLNAGKPIDLLPVLAPALSVALAGEITVTAVRPAHLAQSEGDIDECHTLSTEILLFRTAGSQDQAVDARTMELSGLVQLPHRHAGEPLYAFRPYGSTSKTRG
jgi:hypothetical protein